MRLAFRFLVTVAIGTLALSGCGRKEVPVPPAPPRVTVQQPEPSPVSAETYFNAESSRALLVVRASELAVQRSASSRTRQLASRLKADHTGIAAQLSMAGRRLNLLPPATLLRIDQMLFDGLLRATDFDVAYQRTMKSAAENCARAHASYADNGSSPTLRPVARFAASVCQEELDAMQ